MRIPLFALLATVLLPIVWCKAAERQVERWGVFEVALKGPSEGNPFTDVELSAEFTSGQSAVHVTGFYDDQGNYIVRFMPDSLGTYHYTTKSNVKQLDGQHGEFDCVKPPAASHGPVRIKDTYHFAYSDGTPYYPFGTTCYAWIHQTEELQEQTLKTLAQSPFNKIRMCIFPKNYAYNRNEPSMYAFAKKPDGKFDFTRFDPSFFQHIEKRITELGALGIEADLILFHPYDNGRWGFDRMDPDSDRRYLRYVAARLSAFRNVWWSMANEYDFMPTKKPTDWDDFFQLVRQNDPYNHMRGVHNGARWYDHTKPWVTHASIQAADPQNAPQWRRQYAKPIIDDECQYEGNIPQRWGNISAGELVNRFWLGTVVGCYVGHGETYTDPNDVLWWSKGGVLHGQSPARIAFLRKIIEEGPPVGIEPMEGTREWSAYPAGHKGTDYYLVYFGPHQPVIVTLPLPDGSQYKADVIDTWNLTITPIEGTFRGRVSIPLPGKPYLALRLRKTP
jgi:hypothetical protein